MKKNLVDNPVINSQKKSLKQSRKNSTRMIKPKSRVKRSDTDESLVAATVKKDFFYRLNYDDIVDAADLIYNNYQGTDDNHVRFFEVISSTEQLETHLENFLQKKTSKRLTLIVNTLNQHWLTLVISRRGNIKVYYADSKNNSEQYKAYFLLFNALKIIPFNLTPDFIQQQDEYNGGLWALENAADINRMLDFDGRFAWGVNQLKQYRGENYFITKRKEFSQKFLSNWNWRQLHPNIVATIKPEQEKFLSIEMLPQPGTSIDNENEPALKRIKIDHKKDVKILLTVFTKRFLISFTQRLAAYHVSAREHLVTMEALKTELLTGTTGALVGAGLSHMMVGTMMGAVPSVAASARAITSKLLVKSQTAQKITRYFDGMEKGSLSNILCEAAADIFYSFEYQFKRVSDKAGEYVAMEKLADDSVSRALAYIKKINSDERVVSKELIEKAVLQGASEVFFNLDLPKFQFRSRGRTLVNDNFENENKKIITTAELYERVGLISFDANQQPNKVYQPLTYPIEFGYRRLFHWEKDDKGELKADLQIQYRTEFPRQDLNDYVLTDEAKKTEVESILNALNLQYFPPETKIPTIKPNNKESILFDLKEPVPDFTGRAKIREELHQILTGSSSNMAVISALSAMTISSTSGFSSHSGSAMQSSSSFSQSAIASQASTSLSSMGAQLSLSGLGGIGKTQLALQYAKEHAADYDNNVLWINAEALESLDASFTKLSRKLRIQPPCCDHVKNLEELVEEVYEYFSDRKSLFIFDNVENYHEIKNFLPKLMQRNKPTILITSRYRHWDNVANVLPLELFITSETIELFEKSGILADTQSIEKLHQLLHGLPLALRQAIAYITLQRTFNPKFSIYDYMNLYKEKGQELLKFDLAHYANDPYLKTVFTTWLITLNKIQSDPELGDTAIHLLELMTYVDPESITSSNFYALKYMRGIPGDLTKYIDHIKKAMFLLTSYSMINTDSEGTFKIHRLIQQVQRINLEQDPAKFKEIITETQLLFDYQRKEVEDTHYLHFLLFMSEYENTREILHCDSIKQLFDKLSKKEPKYWLYFLDLAYHKFSKVRYLEFLSDSLTYSRKEGFIFIVDKSLNYFERQLEAGGFSKEDVCYMFTRAEGPSSRFYSLKGYSRNEDKKLRQKAAGRLVYISKDRIFDGFTNYLNFKSAFLDKLETYGSYAEYLACTSRFSRKKRSLCLREEAPKELEQIKYEAERSHIEKVSVVAHYVNSGLMTKNILSAIVRGDWNEVAINFELIGSSHILGRISDPLLIQGKHLEDEALLEKSLGLENQKLGMLFVNKEVALAGKKLFLGKSLQIASSFVSRGTGVYFAYNLGKQIQAYQAGESELLPEIVANGVITGTTLTEISLESLEYLNYIARVAGQVNPYLEAIAALVWLGSDIYEAEEQVQTIQKHVHLSWAERYVEFWRSFFHYPPSSYLQAKANNAQLVEHIVDFLKNHTDFSRYIAPIFSPELKLYENSWVLLDYRRCVALDSVMPDQLSEGHLFCQSGIPAHEDREQGQATYFCHLAMGVEYTHNRSAEINLINLGTGNDTVDAFASSPNYFFVQNGEKKYTGGDEGSIFRLEGNAIIGQLMGGKKSDALLLEQFSPEGSAYILIDHENYLCGQQLPLIDFAPLPCNTVNIKLSGINQIYGRRQQQDIIYLNPDIHFVDGHGGVAEQPDVVFITEHSCKNPTAVLRNNTLVLFPLHPLMLMMDYRIPKDETGTAEIRTDFSTAVQHRFFFDCALDDVLIMHAEQDALTIVVGVESDRGATFTLTISNLDANPSNNITNFEKNSSYFFQNTEIKLVNNQQLFAQELATSKSSLEESIERYSEIAKYLNKTLTLQLRDNSTLAIGRGEHEIFYADGLIPSHLVGNCGENVYQLTANNATHFPLARITLYRLSCNEPELTERIDTLDLRELIKYIKKTCPQADITYQISLREEDLVLMLMSSTPAEGQCSKVKTVWYLADIHLKTGIDWYQNLDVLLEDNIPKRMVTADAKIWTLQDAPLMFTESKKIIALTDQDLGAGTEISLLRNSGNYSFFRNVSDLIMTNIHTSPLDACTIVAHDYYRNPVMKEKFLSAKLDFLDEDFYLKEYQALMDEAQSFSNFVKQLEKPGSEFKHSSSFIPILSKELPKLRRKRQIGITSDSYVTSLGINIGIGLVISGLLSLRLFTKYRNFPIENIPLSTIVIAGLSSLKPADAQQQNTLVSEMPLDFHRGFSIESNCLTAETPMGWLAVCENKRSIMFLKSYQNSCSFYFESYQVNNDASLQRVGEGVWETNLCEISRNGLAEEIYPLLPPHWQEQFREKKIHQQIWAIWKQRTLMSVAQSLNDGLVLYTPGGNLFKALGLSPDWQAREDRYLLNRCWFAFDQQGLHSNSIFNRVSLFSIGSELALLHPITQRMYTRLTHHQDVSKAKFVVRFLADVLQLGFYNICHLAHVLEYSFPANESVKNISLGLRMANYFYFLTGDLHYWHLGLALFFLPQVPQLLDHLGIAATRGLHTLCNQLASCLIGQTLLQKLSVDEERQAQADHELSCADVRVQQGRQRLSAFVTSSANFFTNRLDSCSANDEDKKESRALQFFS